jgi:hypothetical protein
MFPERYFANRYFAPRYFANIGAVYVASPGGGLLLLGVG